MARILPLSDLVIGRIAAGEAIVRPASVVKELIDNCLDAGATDIRVDVQGGGVRNIRVSDNGSGIPGEDLPLAVQRHATSKLRTSDDLERILTMGFRGEGLASIGSVSRLTLTSRSIDDAHAWSIMVDHGTVWPVKPSAGAVGTTVEVAEIFGQVPARRRGLKSESVEWSHIEEMLRHAALAHPEVAFTWTHNDRIRGRYPVANDRVQRMTEILGTTLVQGSAVIDEHSSNGHRLHGVLSLAGTAPSVLFVNDRAVRDHMVTHALHEAYRKALGRERSGTWCLFLTMDPIMVDVNVHPTKSEVRFHEAAALHGLLMGWTTKTLKETFGEAAPTTAGGASPTNVTGQGGSNVLATSQRPGTVAAQEGVGESAPTWYAPWMRSTASPGVERTAPLNDGPTADTLPGSAGTTGQAVLETTSPGALYPQGAAGRAVAVLKDRFVVVERPEGMVLIDHLDVQQRATTVAWTEKMAQQGRLDAEPLMVPMVVRHDGMDLAALIERHQDRLQQWGLDLSAQSTSQAVVRSLPMLPGPATLRWDMPALSKTVIDFLCNENTVLHQPRWIGTFAVSTSPVPGLSLNEAQRWIDAQGGALKARGARWSWDALADLINDGADH